MTHPLPLQAARASWELTAASRHATAGRAINTSFKIQSCQIADQRSAHREPLGLHCLRPSSASCSAWRGCQCVALRGVGGAGLWSTSHCMCVHRRRCNRGHRHSGQGRCDDLLPRHVEETLERGDRWRQAPLDRTAGKPRRRGFVRRALRRRPTSDATEYRMYTSCVCVCGNRAQVAAR